jgi:hypothetical protein
VRMHLCTIDHEVIVAAAYAGASSKVVYVRNPLRKRMQ